MNQNQEVKDEIIFDAKAKIRSEKMDEIIFDAKAKKRVELKDEIIFDAKAKMRADNKLESVDSNSTLPEYFSKRSIKSEQKLPPLESTNILEDDFSSSDIECEDEAELVDYDFGEFFKTDKKRKKEKKKKKHYDTEDSINKFVASLPINSKPDPSTNQTCEQSDLILNSLEEQLLSKLHMLRFEGGLYYFNGYCYIPLRDEMETLEVFRSYVSESALGVKSLRPFNDLYKFIKTSPLLIPDDLNERLQTSKKYVVLNNGALNLKKLKLTNPSPKIIKFFKIDASWDTTPPKRFLKFLRSSCGNDEQIMTRVAEVIGYLLSGSNDGKVFFVIGTASNSGKSTLGELLKNIIGENLVSAIPPHKLGERFALGSNRGKILNLAMDVPKGKLNAVAVSNIKAITGNDMITIEEKYQKAEMIKSQTRFLFGTNHPITIPTDEDDEAFWERMIIIPFNIKIDESKRDPKLLEKLLKEKDSIVTYCLRHYRKVFLNNHRFSECDEADIMKQKWQKGEESYHSWNRFWYERVEVTGRKSDYVFSTDLYEAYREYCKERGWEPINNKAAIRWVESNIPEKICQYKRIHKTDQNPRHGFVGIKKIE